MVDTTKAPAVAPPYEVKFRTALPIAAIGSE